MPAMLLCGTIAGAVVSTTSMVKVVCTAGLLALSVWLHLTVVVPKANVAPDAGRQVAGPVPSTMSVHSGASYVTAAPAAEVASTFSMFGCDAMTGGVESITFTLKVSGSASFPAASVALQVMVVVPSAYVSPDA